MDIEAYNHIRSGGTGFIEIPRGLIAVWGKEAVQFLDGMITNDVKTLEDGQQKLAAFPNAQGRLLAVVRVLRLGDRFLIETEEATREKVFQNLFRFTFAGDFFVEDLTEQYRYFELVGSIGSESGAGETAFFYKDVRSRGLHVPVSQFEEQIKKFNSADRIAVDEDTHETLRIESGIPKYGIDMDENTIVPELGLDGLVSYTKGCYIGQEIIARIHFRGHVAKQLTGLVLSEQSVSADAFKPGTELTNEDGKNAGRITSVTYSPKLDKTIALGYVRYDYLVEGTKLVSGPETVTVTALPFV